MLSELLAVISQEKVLSLSDLARHIGCTPEETSVRLAQLGRMGYIEKKELGQACGLCAGGSHCDHCPDSGGQELILGWHLTEKGKTYLAKRKRDEL